MLSVLEDSIDHHIDQWLIIHLLKREATLIDFIDDMGVLHI